MSEGSDETGHRLDRGSRRLAEEVFDHLDVLANHEAFTDHFLVDWETSGPREGVGAKARMRVKKPGPEDWLEMEVIESERPRRNVERSTARRDGA